MDTIENVIGARITSARMNLGISQREMAKRAGISPQMISRYVSGDKQGPTIETLLKIADVCNVSLDYLVGRGDDKLEPPPPPSIPVYESESYCHICTRSSVPINNPIFCCGEHYKELLAWLDKE